MLRGSHATPDRVRRNHDQSAVAYDFDSLGKGFVGNGANLAHDTSLFRLADLTIVMQESLDPTDIPVRAFLISLAAALRSQIRLAHLLVVHQLLGVAFHGDAPGFEHIRTIGDRQGHIRVLFDQQHGNALIVQLANNGEDLFDEFRDRPIDGSSIRIVFGWLIRARPIASICCSPPESVPAFWLRRSFRRGNMSNTMARSSAM